MSKCENCGSSINFIDAELDLFWCKSCGYVENVDFRSIPKDTLNEFKKRVD